MLALQGHTPEEIHQRIPSADIGECRKLLARFLRDGALPKGMAHVRRQTMAELRDGFGLPGLRLAERQASQVDPFVKFAFRGQDEELFETVRIPLEKPKRYSVCVSSQVGCALGCRFCATGRMGLRRNLQIWEIVEQVAYVNRELSAAGQGRVHGVVFQGMGEPMANLDHVLRAIAVCCEPSGLAIDARTITVCTSGLPSGIARLAKAAPNVRLGLSLGSAFGPRRRLLMPIEDKFPLDEVLAAAEAHALATRRAPMWTITLLRGQNDRPEDAKALAERIHRFRERTGKSPRLSIIPYNPIAEGEDDPFQRVDAGAEKRFRDVLASHGVGSHRRYSGGGDVSAACGQLATEARGKGIGPAGRSLGRRPARAASEK